MNHVPPIPQKSQVSFTFSVQNPFLAFQGLKNEFLGLELIVKLSSGPFWSMEISIPEFKSKMQDNYFISKKYPKCKIINFFSKKYPKKVINIL